MRGDEIVLDYHGSVAYIGAMKNTAKRQGTPAAAWFYAQPGFHAPAQAEAKRCEVTDESISDGRRAVRRCRLADCHEGKHLWAAGTTE